MTVIRHLPPAAVMHHELPEDDPFAVRAPGPFGDDRAPVALRRRLPLTRAGTRVPVVRGAAVARVHGAFRACTAIHDERAIMRSRQIRMSVMEPPK